MYKLIKKFGYAFQGLVAGWKSESSFRIQVFVALAVVIAGLVLKLTKFEWLFVVLVIGMVLSLEMMNSVLEKMLDIVNPEKHQRIKIVKDTAAAVVLIASIAAVVVGLIIFIPHLL